MATKKEITSAFDNAIRLPIIWRDEPSIICEDQMFVCTDIPTAELGDDERSDNVFLYESEREDEQSLRVKYAIDKGEKWYIPSHAEYHAIMGTVDVDTELPWFHDYLGKQNHERTWASDYKHEQLSEQQAFEHLRYLVQDANKVFQRMLSSIPRYRITEKHARYRYERVNGMIDAAMYWGLLDRRHHSALVDRLMNDWAHAMHLLRKSRLAEKKAKGGAK